MTERQVPKMVQPTKQIQKICPKKSEEVYGKSKAKLNNPSAARSFFRIVKAYKAKEKPPSFDI